jgi:AcrR family transcriptional regulator
MKPGKREQTKARNRSEILAAARKVFGALGYESATVRDIVRATDLSVGTFYEYFRDKDEIFVAVAEEAWSDLRARVRSLRRRRDVPLEARAHLAYRTFFEFVVERPQLHDILDRLFWSSTGEPAQRALRLAIEELEEDLLPDFTSGALDDEDPELVAAAMVGTALLVARQLRVRGPLDPEEAARFCTRFTLGGLTTSRSSPPASRNPTRERRSA